MLSAFSLYLVKVLALPVHCRTLALFLLVGVVWLSWPVRTQTLASLALHTVTSLCVLLPLLCVLYLLYLCVGVWLRRPASMWWCVGCGCVGFIQLCWRAGLVCRWCVRARFACALLLFSARNETVNTVWVSSLFLLTVVKS